MFRIFSLSLFFLFVLPVLAEEAVEIRSVKVGVEGFYKNGLWTLVTVEWSGEKTVHSLVVSAVDSDGTPITYRTKLDGGNGTGNKGTIYTKLGRKDGSITVKLVLDKGEDKTMIEQFQTPDTSVQKQISPVGNPAKRKDDETSAVRFYEPVLNERPIYLIIGDEDIGLQGAVAELALREDRRPLLVKVKSVADLPDQWFGYEAVEMIVLTTTEPKLFEGITANSPQIKAIADWVQLGGRLLFCAGKDAVPFLEPEDGALRTFLPGKFSKMTELRQGTPLETFVNSKRPIFMNGTPDAPYLKMPVFTQPEGQEPSGITFVKDGDLPLVKRFASGFGMVIYFGGDLSGRPLNSWRDRVALVQNMLQWSQEKTGSLTPRNELIQLGYNDISGQIRSALDRFDGVRIIPFSVILIILAVYWIAVGLLDWFLVHKILKRPVLTWITFPLWIILFGTLTYILAAAGRPNKAILQELDLVDVDSKSGIVRYSTWGNLYSPNDARYSLKLAEEPIPLPGSGFIHGTQHTLLSWNGLPGSGLGGMAPKTVSPTVWQTGSEQTWDSTTASAGAIENVPVPVRGTKSFFGQRSDLGSMCRIESKLADEEGIPIGTIKLPNGMPALDNCVLIYGRWMLELGTLEPGQTVSVGKPTPRREARELLLQQEVLRDTTLRRMGSYNPQSVDLNYIVRVLTLYKALGGYDMTGLHHIHHGSLDMSELLTADKVLFIGTQRKVTKKDFGGTPRLFCENIEPTRTVIVRQSLPVTLTPLSPRLRLEQDIYKEDRLKEKDPTIKSTKEYKMGDM